MKTLLVDDSTTVRNVFGNYIKEMGHETTIFEDAESALAAFRETPFELAILDWVLPGMSGIELCQKIRSSPMGERCVVIMLTSKNKVDDLHVILDAGAEDYIMKPVSEKHFKTRIRIAEKTFMRKCDILATTSDLQQARIKLESRVEERTRDLKESNEMLSNSLAEKKVLLMEIHHRVKNNMAIISAFLDLQSMLLEDNSLRIIIKGCRQRIKSMALLHEDLYMSKDFKHLDVKQYVDHLLNEIVNAWGREDEVRINMEIGDVQMDIDLMIPFGLILNEAVSNSLRHAYVNADTLEINISLAPEGQGTARLEISDNGTGLPPDKVIENKKTLGLKIINALVTQIDGSIEIIRHMGTKYRITFPLSEG